MHPSSDAVEAGLTRRLVDLASRIELASLPPAIVERAKDLVVDHLGVALRGYDEPWTQMVRSEALSQRAAPVVALYDGHGTSARNAAMVNGTAGHALELDDTHDRSLTHPGAVVIAASLAMAQQARASGGSLLEAIVAGYEVQCRIGMHIGQPMIERGVHPTASLGVFGAVTAAAKLLGLDAAKTECAMGIAASMSGGLMQFSQDPEGTMVKRLYGGLPAERGVFAVSLAAAGYTGPRESIEGTFGVARVLAARAIDASLSVDDDAFAIGEISVKLYACCRNFHALIDAALECRGERPFDAADVERIEVRGPRAMIEHHLETRPRSTMAAQYSLPFTTAVALLRDAADPSSFDAAARDDPAILAVVDKVVAIHDEDFQRAFPRHFGGAIAIVTRDGARAERRVLDSKGTPARPADRATLHAKFAAMTRSRMDAAQRQHLLDAVERLDQSRSVDDLVEAFPAAAGHSPTRRVAH